MFLLDSRRYQSKSLVSSVDSGIQIQVRSHLLPVGLPSTELSKRTFFSLWSLLSCNRCSNAYSLLVLKIKWKYCKDVYKLPEEKLLFCFDFVWSKVEKQQIRLLLLLFLVKFHYKGCQVFFYPGFTASRILVKTFENSRQTFFFYL